MTAYQRSSAYALAGIQAAYCQPCMGHSLLILLNAWGFFGELGVGGGFFVEGHTPLSPPWICEKNLRGQRNMRASPERRTLGAPSMRGDHGAQGSGLGRAPRARQGPKNEDARLGNSVRLAGRLAPFKLLRLRPATPSSSAARR